MNDIQKRFLMFLLGCIPARLSIGYISKNYKQYRPILGYFALIVGVGFFYIYVSGSRKVGAETMGNKIWWNCLRPLHGLLYLLFAYYTLIEKRNDAWKIVLLDTMIGLTAFFIYHCRENNIRKLKLFFFDA